MGEKIYLARKDGKEEIIELGNNIKSNTDSILTRLGETGDSGGINQGSLNAKLNNLCNKVTELALATEGVGDNYSNKFNWITGFSAGTKVTDIILYNGPNFNFENTVFIFALVLTADNIMIAPWRFTGASRIEVTVPAAIAANAIEIKVFTIYKK